MAASSNATNLGTKDVSMSALPLSQRTEAWDIIEAGFWDETERKRLDRYAKAKHRWQQSEQAAIAQIHLLQDRSRSLRQDEERLSRELMDVQSQSALVVNTHDQETRRLDAMQDEHNREKQQLLKKENQVETYMHDWFKRCRNSDGVHERKLAFPDFIDKRPTTTAQQRDHQSLTLPPLANLDLPRHQASGDDRIVAIIDSSGNILDRLRYIGSSNPRVANISALAVLGPVKVRHGRRFWNEALPKIYDVTDGKISCWLACRIQATGTEQKTRCEGCAAGNGPFDGCIAVGNDLFPKCGNCEWNNQACLGRDSMPSPGFVLPIHSSHGSHSSHNSPSLASSNTYMADSPSNAFRRLSLDLSVNRAHPDMKAIAAAAEEASIRASNDMAMPPSQTSVSGFTAVNRLPRIEPKSPGMERFASVAPSNAASYRGDSKTSSVPPSRHISPCTVWSVDSPQTNLDEIMLDKLILKHNGAIYTYPKCIEGVPLEKIHPGHSYWDPKWPDLRSLVEPVLRSWEEKHNHASELQRQGKKVGSVKYQYGRQVNRGKTILEFLMHGVISPYQLLSKRFMSVGKGSITSYDTLFRLCDTINELAKYKLDIEPVEWLRQRLHELVETQGAGFNFSKTIHDFYNDSKLASLRAKSGFKSIGRPSGIKMPRRDGSMDDSPHAKKRKSMHLDSIPSPSGSVDEQDIVEPVVADEHSDKKQKAVASVLDSLETGDVSDADSYTGAEISKLDFRLYQVKSRLWTTSERATQYWSWSEEHSMFEHHMVKEVKPVVWAALREPIDFSLRLEDVVKIAWNLKALRVYLVMSDRHICFEDDKPRGDMMVAFKRPNTMRRFINFCRREEIELVEETWKKMEHLWASMNSELIPAGDEEPSARLQE